MIKSASVGNALMKWTNNKVFVCLVFFPASLIPVGHVLVQVNNPAALTCNQSCAGDVKWMLSRRSDLPVSECRKGVCVEGKGFENRTGPVQGEPFLHLNPVMYNDQGWYICYCNNLELCRFHLEVVSPRLESASAGANVTLPCYADTKKNIRDHEIFIEWEKDGQRVVMLKEGDMAYGSGFKGRSLVSPSQYKNGDLSLTLLQVQQSDGGLYRCTHRDKELGEPEAINLSIIEPPVWAAVKQSTFPWCQSLLVVVLVILVVFLFFKFHKHIRRQGNCTMCGRGCTTMLKDHQHSSEAHLPHVHGNNLRAFWRRNGGLQLASLLPLLKEKKLSL